MVYNILRRYERCTIKFRKDIHIIDMDIFHPLLFEVFLFLFLFLFLFHPFAYSSSLSSIIFQFAVHYRVSAGARI